MVFRDNFKRFIEEKTGMKTSNFLKELGMSYSVVKSLDEEGIEALTEKQLNKFCDALELSKEEFARLWDEDYFEDEVPVACKRMSCVPGPAAESLPKVLLFRWKSWQHCMKSLALSWRR